MELIILIPVALLTSTISGAIGMGGGVALLAVMASILAPGVVIPVHGVVQVVSNSSRTLILLRRVQWRIFFLYLPAQLVGIVIGISIYQGSPMTWLKPAIGTFVLVYLLWDRFKPKRLQLPLLIFAPAGLIGGLLTILVGATGPFLAAFFLRDDIDREQIVATKAVIQTVGHLAKVPAFLSVGFPYAQHIDLILPLLVCAVAGTWIGTRLLKRMDQRVFGIGFRLALAVLGIRLAADVWI
jgi:uncharacterized membrane protein YfcA